MVDVDLDVDDALELCDDIEGLLLQIDPRWQGKWVDQKRDLIEDIRTRIDDRRFCTGPQGVLLKRIKDEVEDKVI